MLKEGAVKLAAFHASEKNGARQIAYLKKRKDEIRTNHPVKHSYPCTTHW